MSIRQPECSAMRDRLLVAVILCLSAILCSTSSRANPNSIDAEQPLVVHGTIPEAKELAKKIFELYRKHEAAIIDLNTRTDQPSRLPYKQMSNAAGDLFLAKREAKRLRLMGEPIGVHLETVLQLVHAEMYQLMSKFRGSTPGAAQFQKNMIQARRAAPRNDKQLDQISAAIKNNQLEQAEKQLEKMGRELEEVLFIMRPGENTPFYKKFLATMSELDGKLQRVRRDQYFQEAKNAAAKQLQAVSDFNSESKRVQAEMAAQGKVTIQGGDDVGAPGAIEYLGDQWGNASAALTRSTAIQWAFTPSSPSQTRENMMPRATQLATTAKEAIAGVIDAAAVATPAEAVPAVYSQILSQLSYIDRRMGGSGVSKDCEPALERLAAKSNGFPAKLVAYQRAVEQPLIWRSRFARQHAEKLQRGYPDASGQISQKFPLKEFSKPAVYRRGNPGPRVLVTPYFAESPSWKVADAKPFVLGLRVSEQNMLRLYEGSLTALVPHSRIHYSNVAVGMPIDRELDDLKTSLIINDDHPPLTMEAADAVSSALSQDFLDVGGSIRQLHLEAAVTRFITLPGKAHHISPLGRLPTLADETPAIEQACWRLDIEPHWVRHRYFTVAIRSKLPK